MKITIIGKPTKCKRAGNMLRYNGKEVRLVPLNVKPSVFRSLTLRAVSTLIRANGKWILDGVPLPDTATDERSCPDTVKGWSDFFTRELLRETLEQMGEEQSRQVVGVAWSEELKEETPSSEREFEYATHIDYSPDGARHFISSAQRTLPGCPSYTEYLPILLRELSVSEPKPRDDQEPKPVVKERARFLNAYSVAIIPQTGGKLLRLAIEPELQALVKQIIDAGGLIPRRKLREGKSENYRPERLLKSKIGKCLVMAGLIGTHESKRGRSTTTYWAKAQA